MVVTPNTQKSWVSMLYALKQRETVLTSSELVEGKLETISELGRLCG